MTVPFNLYMSNNEEDIVAFIPHSENFQLSLFLAKSANHSKVKPQLKIINFEKEKD